MHKTYFYRGHLHSTLVLKYILIYLVVLVVSEPTVDEIRGKVDHATNDVAYLTDEVAMSDGRVVVPDSIQGSGESLLQSIEYVFNGTISGIVRCSQHQTMSSIVNQLRNNDVPVSSRVVWSLKKASTLFET